MIEIYKNAAAKNKLSNFVPEATLVISFYKNIRMLELVLASLENQTAKNFNVFICDDGSPEAIRQMVYQLLQKLSYPSTHLWHEDLGFRKNRILNWALHGCETPYMIFIDQDCILHSKFIQEHLMQKKPKSVLCGRRINLTSFVSQLLTPEKVRQHYLEKNIWWIILVGLWMKDNNGIKGLYFKTEWLRHWANKKPRGIVGCNFSVFKQDLLAINGFDTRYEGAGFGEDSDIEQRLTQNGVTMLPACNTVVQYHIYHKLLTRSDQNEQLFNQIVSEKNIQTPFGLSQQIT